MKVDRESLTELVNRVMAEAMEFLTDGKAPVDFEAFARAVANGFVEEAGNIVPPGLGVSADLKKCAAYGLTYGAMDSMYACEPRVLKKEYAERRQLELN
jgi:hypothetical protein